MSKAGLNEQLFSAIEKGDINKVKESIKAGANVNAVDLFEKTPLHRAVFYGHKEVVKLLIENGAEVEAVDKYGWTFLHLACDNGHEEVVNLLIENGAEVEAVDKYGWAPLHLAAYKGHEEVVKFLLENGAEVNAVNCYKKTPLHSAAHNRHIKVVKLLLENEADPLLQDTDGKTPRDLVNKWVNDAETKNKIIRLLEEAEAKQSKKGDEEMSSHSMQGDTDSDYESDYEEEELGGGDEQHNSPFVSLSSSNVEDHNQNEPSFFSKHKCKIAVGVGTAVALIVCATLCLTANLPALSIIGIVVLSGFIAGSIAFGVAYMVSKPSTEVIEKPQTRMEEQSLEQHAHEGVQDLPV